MAESSSSDLLDPQGAITDAPPDDEPLHLNELLRGQPAEAEAALFRGLRLATGPVAWLARGMNISSQEAQARLDAALKSIQPALR